MADLKQKLGGLESQIPRKIRPRVKGDEGDLQTARVGVRVAIIVGEVEIFEDLRSFDAEFRIGCHAVGELENLWIDQNGISSWNIPVVNSTLITLIHVGVLAVYAGRC